MSSSFDPRVSPLDPRGGSVIVEAFRSDWQASASFDLEVTVRFPVKDPRDDAQREIMRQQQGASLEFSYRVKDFPHKAWLTDLATVIADLFEAEHRAFQRIGFMDDGSPDKETVALVLQRMARLGSAYFHKLFHLRDNENFHSGSFPRREYDTYGNLLMGWLESSDSVQITADRHLIPWPILFAGDADAKPIAIEHFWGYSKNLQLFHDGLTTSTLLRSSWSVAASVDHSDDELLEGARIHEEAYHPFVRFKDRVVATTDPETLFHAFLNADILYHYGHAGSSSRGFELGMIDVNGIKFNAADLERYIITEKIRLPRRKPLLVFLNGCSTSVGAGQGETIPDVLVKYGVGSFCFVATLGAVPPCPAARFALSFFLGHLGVDGSPRPLGESLMEARRRLLEDFGSPIGLLYVAYGRIATVVDVASQPLGVALAPVLHAGK